MLVVGFGTLPVSALALANEGRGYWETGPIRYVQVDAQYLAQFALSLAGGCSCIWGGVRMLSRPGLGWWISTAGIGLMMLGALVGFNPIGVVLFALVAYWSVQVKPRSSQSRDR